METPKPVDLEVLRIGQCGTIQYLIERAGSGHRNIVFRTSSDLGGA